MSIEQKEPLLPLHPSSTAMRVSTRKPRWVAAVVALIGVVFPATSFAADESLAAAPSNVRASIGSELAVSMGATALMAPAIYSTARWVGTSTGNLNTSALPALLLAAILPPAVASGALLFERRREGAHARFITPYLYALGAQVLVLTASVFLQTFVGNPRDLLLLSAVTGAACGGAATLGAELKF